MTCSAFSQPLKMRTEKAPPRPNLKQHISSSSSSSALCAGQKLAPRTSRRLLTSKFLTTCLRSWSKFCITLYNRDSCAVHISRLLLYWPQNAPYDERTLSKVPSFAPHFRSILKRPDDCQMCETKFAPLKFDS